MALLIDGYNLLHASHVFGRARGPRALEAARAALVELLAHTLEPAVLAETTIVFDAAEAPPGLPDIYEQRGLTIRFARGYPSADELIEELIKQDAAPRRLTVVSSDHRLHRAARRRRATAVDSDEWLGGVLRDRRVRASSAPVVPLPPRPVAPTQAEVEFWLREFDVGDTDLADPESGAAMSRANGAGSVFPREYLEELIREIEAELDDERR